MKLIKGIHHVKFNCRTEEIFKKTCEFYGTLLELPVIREWDAGIMFDTGAGLLEIFHVPGEVLNKGILEHIAFATDDVDGCVESVRACGYEITIDPKDIVIPSAKPFPARIAFCIGPVGEEVEFFCEK